MTQSSEHLTAVTLNIFRLNGILYEWGNHFAAPLGLNTSRWQVLGAVLLSETPPTVPQIAEKMGITRQGALKQVNVLIEEGLLAAQPNPAHQRAQLYVLHECNHLSPLLEGIADGTTVYADKGYDSAENRQHLEEHQLLDGIMRKAHRNRPLTEAQTKRNRYLSKTRYVVEQSFGTLHRKFRYARAAYFGLFKVSAQSHLKAMCLNLLKAANRLSVPVAA